MKVSITKAAELSGVSRTTLYTDMNSGKLSYHSVGKNRKSLDVAELERVYGSLNIIGSEKVPSTVKTEQSNFTPDTSLTELVVLRERVEMMENHSSQERAQYESRIESLETALTKSQDGHNIVTRILEDQRSNDSKTGEWEKSLKALEARIANQEAAEKTHKEREEKLLKRALQYEAAYKKEKTKTFFQKLFG